MIKNKKYGFTVVEILLALGIISVIATMGFTFAKKSINNSYNYYVYTAYKGITDAITEANLNEETKFTGNYTDENDFKSNNGKFYKKIKNLLTKDNFVQQGGSSDITTTNGTEITFGYNNTNDNFPYVPIKVVLPSQKGVDSTLCLKYFPKSDLNILVPTGVNTNIDGCRSTVDLLNREDLVSFYIDDGIKGRVLQGINDSSGQATAPEFKGSLEYMSAHDAICNIVRANNLPSFTYANTTWVDSCSNSSKNGIIKFVAPRRFLK